MKRKFLVSILVIAMALMSWQCAEMTRKQKGTIIGGSSGAIIGGIIGKKAGNTKIGAVLGAIVGGAAGAYIGKYMDDQAAEIRRDLENAKVERVGEGIKITFDSGILFDVDKASLKPASKQNLSELAQILNKYSDTNILLEGHTDNTGSDTYNQTLSRQRAEAVSNYLSQLSVSTVRMNATGYGESRPIADNSTVQGRQQNRRVEVAIFANDKLKKAAQENVGG